jgi:hypothetical protein
MSNTMTTPTTIHDSTTCQANAGEPCETCNAAELSPDIREWLAGQCNRLVNGKCWNGRCFRRGGYSGSDINVTYEMAMEIPTCEALEVYRALGFGGERQ